MKKDYYSLFVTSSYSWLKAIKNFLNKVRWKFNQWFFFESSLITIFMFVNNFKEWGGTKWENKKKRTIFLM